MNQAIVYIFFVSFIAPMAVNIIPGIIFYKQNKLGWAIWHIILVTIVAGGAVTHNAMWLRAQWNDYFSYTQYPDTLALIAFIVLIVTIVIGGGGLALTFDALRLRMSNESVETA